MGIESVWIFITFVLDHAINLSIKAVIFQEFQHVCGRAFPSQYRRALFARDLVTEQYKGVRQIFEDKIEKVMQHVNEYCLFNKWYL